MKQELFQVALVVKDYDQAIDFYVGKLRFILKEDTKISEAKRWVVVTPPGSHCSLLLAKASGEEQTSRIGNQTGGRVFFFLHTDDLERDYAELKTNQVQIVREPSVEEFGKVCVFADLYGNLWDLIQPL
jgi:catechol 2,3-dioxygenase-like lactoylglutathione lyase family enzyme